MREKKLVKVLQIVNKKCDNCGESTDCMSEGLSFSYTFGFNSDYDTKSISIDLCDKCVPIILGEKLMKVGFKNAD